MSPNVSGGGYRNDPRLSLHALFRPSMPFRPSEDLVSTTPPTSLMGFIRNFVEFLPMI